jgi:hypothetical protein
MWVVLIAGSAGSALRAVCPPNLYITPDVGAIVAQHLLDSFNHSRQTKALEGAVHILPSRLKAGHERERWGSPLRIRHPEPNGSW